MTVLAGVTASYVAAAASAYGAGVLARVQEAAADATVGLGGRLLRRLLVREAPAMETAVMELAEDPVDEDRAAAVRLQIQEMLAVDAHLAADLSKMLAAASVTVTAAGERSVAAQTINGVVVTGDRAQVSR